MNDNYYKEKVFKLEIEELKVKLIDLEDKQKDAENNIHKLNKLYVMGS